MNFKDLPGIEPCFFKKGDILIHDGDRVDYIYYLRKGTVYREIVTETGIESILSCKAAASQIHSSAFFCCMAFSHRIFQATILWLEQIVIACAFQLK